MKNRMAISESAQDVSGQPALRKNLEWWDIAIVACILFGGAIVESTLGFIYAEPGNYESNLVFTSADNWYALLSIAVELSLAFIYLKIRRFDFSQWTYRITLRDTILAAGVFVLVCLCTDTLTVLFEGPNVLIESLTYGHYGLVFDNIDISLVLFSLANGCYEEVFFLGVCTAVSRNKLAPVFIASLIIRFSFHTYQGIPSALSVALCAGVLFYALYIRKQENLYPYMLAHGLVDIFGAGFIG